MYKMFGRSVGWWCRKIIKYGLALFVCYCVVFFYIKWEAAAERRERTRAISKECYEKISNIEHAPISGGSFIDRNRLRGFHLSISPTEDVCIAAILEGSFWWTGTEVRTAYQERDNEPDPSWGHYNVAARLFTPKASTEPFKIGLRYTEWPDDLVVKLKNYPGLELWLKAPPPSNENQFAVKNFIVRDWRRRDGTPRVIMCNGLSSPTRSVLESGLSRDELLTFNKSRLENLDFGDLDAYCTIELHDFDFAGGDARVWTGTGSLRGAATALPLIREYLSRSIITGK